MLDGAPIVVVAVVDDSTNSKTGAMVQTHILVDGVSPLDAVRSGLDASICGSCQHRGRFDDILRTWVERSCYVNLGQGPRAVQDGVARGIYPTAALEDLPRLTAGRTVRLGAYGDPAAVPFGVWLALLQHATGSTGYTHQWRDPRFAALKLVCQASCDSEADALEAQAAGWRWFRVRKNGEPLLDAEFVCPASEEAGRRTVCAKCLLCSGTSRVAKSPVIIAHGSLAGNFRKAA